MKYADPMGRTDEKGDFVFEHGYGRGIVGTPYDANIPQGQIYGVAGSKSLPFWCKHDSHRRVTLLVYMERRAFQSLRQQPGSYEERLERVTARLSERHAGKVTQNEKRKRTDPKRYWRHKPLLEATKDFHAWVTKVIDDYFPTSDEAPHWDVGQCTYRCGVGMDNKILIRQLLLNVNRIGNELFPEP